MACSLGFFCLHSCCNDTELFPLPSFSFGPISGTRLGPTVCNDIINHVLKDLNVTTYEFASGTTNDFFIILSSDYYVVVEVDSYGHYFRKAKSKLVCRSAQPRWNESFTIDLEGSQNLRLLLYEDAARPVLRGKCTVKVSVRIIKN